MKFRSRKHRSMVSAVLDRDRRGLIANLSATSESAIAVAARVVRRAAGTMRATQAGATGTTSAMQVLPDSTLRSLAATSVGLGAGFFLTGKPRLIVAAGIAPALLAAVAIALRPVDPKVRVAAVR